MDKRGTRKAPGRAVFWSLMAASGGALAFLWAIAHTGWALECLRDWTDHDCGHPGPVRVYAPTDFWSMNQWRDG